MVQSELIEDYRASNRVCANKDNFDLLDIYIHNQTGDLLLQQLEKDKVKNQKPEGQQRNRKATEKGKLHRISLLDEGRKFLTNGIITVW